MIWCVENDAATRNIEVYALQSAGFEAKGFDSGTSCWETLQRENPQLVMLDMMLPGMDGLELLERIRASAQVRDLPVIMATGKVEYDIVRCLDSGADDCLVKPFGMLEMVSRVRAVLRRYGFMESDNVLQNGRIEVDLNGHSVKAKGRPVELTYKEFEILCLLMKNPGKVLSREQLYTKIWESAYDGKSRTVDVHIRTLRKKLGACGDMIEGVRFMGYRMKEV